MTPTDRREWGLLIGSIGLCVGTGAIGGFATSGAISSWYRTLTLPWFTPPNSVFGPVWTVLYILMGVALFLVVRDGIDTPQRRGAVTVFGLQLGLNLAWSLVFFGARSIIGGLVVIVVLWAAIVWTVKRFYPLSRPAAYLLVPYLLWVSYASALNAAVFVLN